MLDTLISIGDTLKDIRETKGFHLQEVAENTSINYTSLSRIETGKRLPTKPQVQSLAEFYSYSENDLIRHLISDKILYEIQNEDLGLEGFHLAEQKLKYGINLFNDYKNQEKFQLQSRRYIGNKAKLTDWIMQIIESETEGNGTFIDIFSGTSIVAKSAMEKYKTVILNDILYSNNVTYQAFYGTLKWNSNKLVELANEYNTLNSKSIRENYFSKNFGGKFYEKEISKQIGYIRQDIEKKKKNNELNSREYAIQTSDFKGAKIYQEDANELVRNIKGDIAYIDPPYNSRQYSRFYHIYENLVQWKKPKLYGVALKPEPENMSKYCTVQAKDTFKDLVENLDVKYLAVSYNNTYKSKSKSSKNKITLEEIIEILNNVGTTKTFEQSHTYFNTGKTDFNDHKEFLFLTKKYDK